MKKITRSHEDRIIAGVCGGFAEYFNIDSTIVRLLWIFVTIFGGIGILAYIFSIIPRILYESGIYSLENPKEGTLINRSVSK